MGASPAPGRLDERPDRVRGRPNHLDLRRAVGQARRLRGVAAVSPVSPVPLVPLVPRCRSCGCCGCRGSVGCYGSCLRSGQSRCWSPCCSGGPGRDRSCRSDHGGCSRRAVRLCRSRRRDCPAVAASLALLRRAVPLLPLRRRCRWPRRRRGVTLVTGSAAARFGSLCRVPRDLRRAPQPRSSQRC